MLILFNKPQKFSLLFSCDSFSRHTIIHNYCCKLELKRILSYQIIINCHLKSWSYNTSDRMDRTLPEHRELMEAIKASDPDRAEAASRMHNITGLEDHLRRMEAVEK